MSVFNSFERMMAIRYLRSKRKEGFVSVIAGFSLLGICLGVATLIIVMSVMNGFRQELLSRILGINGHLEIYSISAPNLRNYQEASSLLHSIDGVEFVMPVIEGQVMVTSDYSSSGAMIKSMDFSILPKDNVIYKSIPDEALPDIIQGGKIALGSKLAHRLGVRKGDEVTLISPEGKITAFGSVPKMKSFEVAALFDVGMFEYDDNFILMPISDGQMYFDMKNSIGKLEVFLTLTEQTKTAKIEAKELLGNGYRVQSWQQSNVAFFNALEVERNVMFLILTLIIIVASFNMISGLIMLVKDKGRNIAVLRTMGATRSSVMRIFFISGALIGVIGTFLGVVLGLSFCIYIEEIRQFLGMLAGKDLFSAEIYFLSRIPAQVDYIEVISVVLMALGLTFLATLYPSWRAARLDPVEALRYE